MLFTSAKSEMKRKSVPGNAYLNKIDAFTKRHCEIGAMYLEYLKGSCEGDSGEKLQLL